jgi:hypothetical protein
MEAAAEGVAARGAGVMLAVFKPVTFAVELE